MKAAIYVFFWFVVTIATVTIYAANTWNLPNMIYSYWLLLLVVIQCVGFVYRMKNPEIIEKYWLAWYPPILLGLSIWIHYYVTK